MTRPLLFMLTAPFDIEDAIAFMTDILVHSLVRSVTDSNVDLGIILRSCCGRENDFATQHIWQVRKA